MHFDVLYGNLSALYCFDIHVLFVGFDYRCCDDLFDFDFLLIAKNKIVTRATIAA